MRTYETDLARLTLVGAVDFQQALTAAAADGGRAADEHIAEGMRAMVVETVFPGSPDDHSTTSTRLVPASFIISSSDQRVISVLAEVLCLSALESAEKHFFVHSLGKWSTKVFPSFHKQKRIVSKDASVILDKLLEKEMLADAKSLLEKFTSEREKHKSIPMGLGSSWWMPSFSELEKIGGPEFTTWISEYVPLYRLYIDAGKLENTKFEGGKLSAAKCWEILLTHSQMVCLTNIVDMYYEDTFTMPNKQLTCGAIKQPSHLAKNKSYSSLFQMLSAIVATGIFLFTITILGRLQMPSLPSWRKYCQGNSPLHTSSITRIQLQSLEPNKLETLYFSVIRRIKDSLEWPGEIVKEKGDCAWIGEVPLYLRNMVNFNSNTLDVSSSSTPNEKFEEMKESARDIASYLVLLSTDGKIVGFQPTSRVAVNHWASNPLTKELYGGKKLSPGFLESGLRINYPGDVVALELLMSVNPESHFALVRPINLAEFVDGQ